METVYIAVIIFIAIALFEPLSIFLTSILIRRNAPANRVKNNNYESAEHSRGRPASVMNEYIHYFPMFLAYEIILAIMFIWIIYASSLSSAVNIMVLSLLIVGVVFEIFVMLLAKAGD